MKALPPSMSLQRTLSLGTGRGLLVTFGTENCAHCFFWVSTAPAKYLEKLSVISVAFPLGLGVPQRRCSLLRHWKLSVSNQWLPLSREWLRLSLRSFRDLSGRRAYLWLNPFIFQRKKHGSWEVKRFIWRHQQLRAGLGHLLTCFDVFYYHSL